MEAAERVGELTKAARRHPAGLATTTGAATKRVRTTTGNDAETAIDCVDSPPITDRRRRSTDRRARQAPFMSYGVHPDTHPLDTCAFWLVPATSVPHIVSAPGCRRCWWSTTDDPATHYQAGVDLARRTRRALLTMTAPSTRGVRRRLLRRLRDRVPGRPEAAAARATC